MSRRQRTRPTGPPGQRLAAASRYSHELTLAMDAHRAGRLEDARRGYTVVLGQEPENFDALNLLGAVATQLGQPDVGEDLIRMALRLRPTSHEALGHLSMALKALGRVTEAEAALNDALEIAPNYLDGLRNLATLRQSAGDVAAALALLERAARIAPEHPAVIGNLGALLLARGDAQRAWQLLGRAARSAAKDPDLLANAARAALETDHVEAGVALCETALRVTPAHRSALVTLSALERIRGRFDVAERHARSALASAAADRGARLNLATALSEMARYDEAIEVFDSLLQDDPGDASARTSRALACLAAGRIAEAWSDHAWRWRMPEAPVPDPPACPEWRGELLSAGVLYVWPEQGVGDEILHASAIPDLASRVANLTVACDPRLEELFARSFPFAQIVPAGSLARRCIFDPADRQCSIASLASVLRPSLESFPRRMGYLQSDPAAVERWRGWLASLGPGLTVGISWRSQNQRGERRLACTDLRQWAPVLAVPGVRFVCLQYDECSAELASARGRGWAPIHLPPGLDQRGDLDGTAALISALDLVVTVATTVSTLAAGVGAPTWQLARGIDWHALGCTHSPWASSMRQIYRRWDRSWDEVLAFVATELDAVARLGGGVAD